MRKVECECGGLIELSADILATAATTVADFQCPNCGSPHQAAYVKGRGTPARLWHAAVEKPVLPYFIEGSEQ